MDRDNVAPNSLLHDVQFEENADAHLLEGSVREQDTVVQWKRRLTMKTIQVTMLAMRPCTVEGN